VEETLTAGVILSAKAELSMQQDPSSVGPAAAMSSSGSNRCGWCGRSRKGVHHLLRWWTMMHLGHMGDPLLLFLR